jgi:HJR/Mrr/RecB family endonuclease
LPPFLVVLAGFGWLSQQPRLILPVLLIAAGFATTALVWYARRGFIAQRHYRNLSRLKMRSPLEFERHVAEYYRRSGFRVTLTKQNGDQGIDVIADGKGCRVGIQVKRYLDGVGNGAVQEVVAGLPFHGCSRGVVITTGRFTASARALAAANHVELIDGARYVSQVTRQLGLVSIDPAADRRAFS